MLYAWIAIMLIALVLEILTRRLIALWAAPAALVSLILSVCELSPLYQILTFLGLFLAGLVLAFLFIKRGTGANDPLRAVIGTCAKVTERIDNEAGCGQVMVNGQYWAARGVYEKEIMDEGDTVNVVAIEGVKLICKK